MQSSTIDTPRFIFIHIPRTAGHSFAQFLLKSFSNQHHTRILTVWDKQFGAMMSLKELSQTPADQLAGYDHIWGHFGYKAIRHLLDSAYREQFHLLTIIREPLKRAISMFNHITLKEFHPQHKEVMAAGLEGFLEEGFIDNHQCRMISASCDAAAAIDKLKNTFSSYCVLDDISSYCEYLKQAFPTLDASSLGHINSSCRRSHPSLSHRTVEHFYRRNAEDLALYDWAAQHWRDPWDKHLA